MNAETTMTELFEGLILKLLKQSHKHSGIDPHEDVSWMAYESFGDYYAANKVMLAPAVYSTPEKRVLSFAEAYVVRQLSGMLHRFPGGRVDFDQMRDVMRFVLESHAERVLALMHWKWGGQVAEIVRDNGALSRYI